LPDSVVPLRKLVKGMVTRVTYAGGFGVGGAKPDVADGCGLCGCPLAF